MNRSRRPHRAGIDSRGDLLSRGSRGVSTRCPQSLGNSATPSLTSPKLLLELAQHEVLAPDLPGYASERNAPIANVSLQVHSDVVAAMIRERFGSTRCCVVGPSVGGRSSDAGRSTISSRRRCCGVYPGQLHIE